jgi:hypothetical protein
MQNNVIWYSVNLYSKIPMKECVMPILGFYYDSECFYVFLPLKRSMYQFLHENLDGKKASYAEKLKLL